MQNIEFSLGLTALPADYTNAYQEVLARYGRSFRLDNGLGVFSFEILFEGETSTHVMWHQDLVRRQPKTTGMGVSRGKVGYKELPKGKFQALEAAGFRFATSAADYQAEEVDGLAVLFTYPEIGRGVQNQLTISHCFRRWNSVARIVVPLDYLHEPVSAVTVTNHQPIDSLDFEVVAYARRKQVPAAKVDFHPKIGAIARR